MSTNGKVIGPGGTSKSAKSTGCQSIGPGGTAGSNVSYSTSRGYDNSKTESLRANYRVSGNANNSKA